MERIETLGYSEVLADLAKRIKGQQLYEAILKSHREESLVKLNCHDDLWWYDEGIVRLSASVLAEVGREGVIEVNVDSHELLRVNGESVKGIEHSQVLDLSDDGERWEGDVLNNQPCGWGVLYDSEGEKKYEGFRIGEVNVCYGTRYYSDIEKVEYDGDLCNGKRWGRGVQYDRTGNTVYEGEWVNDDRFEAEREVTISSYEQSLYNRVEVLTIDNDGDEGEAWTTLELSPMVHLRKLDVKDKSLLFVKEVKLVGLHLLEEATFALFCCSAKEGRFYLKHCEKIKRLHVGAGSFDDYSVCEIEDVPSLEELVLGDTMSDYNSFYYASLVLRSDSVAMGSLLDLPKLKSLECGYFSFHNCSCVILESTFNPLVVIR